MKYTVDNTEYLSIEAIGELLQGKVWVEEDGEVKSNYQHNQNPLYCGPRPQDLKGKLESLLSEINEIINLENQVREGQIKGVILVECASPLYYFDHLVMPYDTSVVGIKYVKDNVSYSVSQ